MVRFALFVSKALLTMVTTSLIAADPTPEMDAFHTLSYKGFAYTMKGSNLLYTENHLERYKDDQLTHHEVIYHDYNGELILEKNIDYSESLVAPAYASTDFRNSRSEGVRLTESDRLLMYCRPDDAPETDKDVIRKPNDLVVDAGFNQFIVKNWDALISGKRMRINFAAPAFGRCIRFVVYKTKEIKVAGHRAYHFRMKTDSLLYRLFSDPIDVSYDAENKRLISYVGLSNVRNKEGKNYHARIVFPLPCENPEDYLADID